MQLFNYYYHVILHFCVNLTIKAFSIKLPRSHQLILIVLKNFFLLYRELNLWLELLMFNLIKHSCYSFIFLKSPVSIFKKIQKSKLERVNSLILLLLVDQSLLQLLVYYGITIIIFSPLLLLTPLSPTRSYDHPPVHHILLLSSSVTIHDSYSSQIRKLSRKEKCNGDKVGYDWRYS